MSKANECQLHRLVRLSVIERLEAAERYYRQHDELFANGLRHAIEIAAPDGWKHIAPAWTKPNAEAVPRAAGSAAPACSHCFGRGFIYVGNALQSGPEAQEEPPTEPCPKCNPSGSANVRIDRQEEA